LTYNNNGKYLKVIAYSDADDGRCTTSYILRKDSYILFMGGGVTSKCSKVKDKIVWLKPLWKLNILYVIMHRQGILEFFISIHKVEFCYKYVIL
jgi:hypothetical protein